MQSAKKGALHKILKVKPIPQIHTYKVCISCNIPKPEKKWLQAWAQRDNEFKSLMY